MKYKVKSKKGRKHESYKVRDLKGITPKGFEIYDVGKKTGIGIFKKKRKKHKK